MSCKCPPFWHGIYPPPCPLHNPDPPTFTTVTTEGTSREELEEALARGAADAKEYRERVVKPMRRSPREPAGGLLMSETDRLRQRIDELEKRVKALEGMVGEK